MATRFGLAIACIAATLLATTLAQAGQPVNATRVCPIDGSDVQVVETKSCTTMGYLMSLGQISSCDFVTVLPVCADSGFPIYREFADDEVGRIREIVKTPEYAQLRGQSRFYRAWFVARQLDGEPAHVPLSLLAGGLHVNAPQTFGDVAYLNAVRSEAERSLDAFDAGHALFLRALFAFAAIHANDLETARRELLDLEKTDSPNPLFTFYLRGIRACLDDRESRYCNPDQKID